MPLNNIQSEILTSLVSHRELRVEQAALYDATILESQGYFLKWIRRFRSSGSYSVQGSRVIRDTS